MFLIDVWIIIMFKMCFSIGHTLCVESFISINKTNESRELSSTDLLALRKMFNVDTQLGGWGPSDVN